MVANKQAIVGLSKICVPLQLDGYPVKIDHGLGWQGNITIYVSTARVHGWKMVIGQVYFTGYRQPAKPSTAGGQGS